MPILNGEKISAGGGYITDLNCNFRVLITPQGNGTTNKLYFEMESGYSRQSSLIEDEDGNTSNI